MTHSAPTRGWDWPVPAEGPPRDFVGYGRSGPNVRWPGDARLVVSLCLNYEEGSERSIAFGDSVNEPNPEYVKAFPADTRDLATESMFEYGSRVGVVRLLRMFDDLDIRCTAFACAVALAVNPDVADWIVESGHEVCSHGLRWTELWTLDREAERNHIRDAVGLFEEVTGVRPVGWYSRYGPSVNTRELLVEEGFLYDSDSYNDELPYYVRVKGQNHLVIPYSMVYNDGKFGGRVGGPDDFLSYLRRGFDYLWQEGAETPKIMSIGLHSRLIGQAARASALREFLEYARSKESVWFARRDEIARWWLEHYPAPEVSQ